MSCLAGLALVLAAAAQTPKPPAQPPDTKPPALVPDTTARPTESGWTRRVYTLRSEVLQETLHVFVGLPPSYGRAERSYPALLLLDGQFYFDAAQDVVRALTASGQIPEPVLVGIESGDRRADFTPTGVYLPDVEDRARAGAYLDFLERELLPAAESTLHAGKPRVLIGHSHAAMFVLHAVAQRPKTFPWVVALDPPTHHERGLVARDLLATLAREDRPALRVVTRRVVFGWSDEQWALVRAAGRGGDLLDHATVPGETHESMFFPAVYQALHALFADASAVGTNDLAPLDVDAHYRALAASYGAEVVPPEPLMHQTVEDFLMEGRGVHAGAWLERSVAAYGKPQDYDDLAARVKTVAARGEPTETVASLLALPRATPEEMRSHLGDWRGSTWMNAGRHTERGLRFWVEDGVVQGEMTPAEGPPIRCEYIRVRPDGRLEFGHRNGMRPRALIVFEEQEPGGAIEGVSVFRGIRFTLPDDAPPPVHHFLFERVAPAK